VVVLKAVVLKAVVLKAVVLSIEAYAGWKNGQQVQYCVHPHRLVCHSSA
jgi:hypothetical protein